MGSDIEVSVLAKDFSACGDQTVRASPEHSNLQTTHVAAGSVEWKVSLPRAGRWRLHARLTSAQRRPCALTVNGAKQADPILGEFTGSWQSDGLAWFVYGPYDLNQGENCLRISFTGGQPHLSELGFSPVEPVAVGFPWRKLPDSRSAVGVAVLRDGGLLAVGPDGNVFTRTSAANGEWKQLLRSPSMLAVTELRDGTLLGVSTDHFLWTCTTPGSPWSELPNSGAVKAVTQLRDGTILGVGVDNILYKRATLSSSWVQIPGSGDVVGVVELASGILVGVGADKQLYSRAMLTDSWTRIPDSGDVIALAELPDGSFLGAGPDLLLRVADRTGPPRQSLLDEGTTGNPPGKEAKLEERLPEEGTALHATGLEDYGYWTRWKQSLPSQAPGAGKPYRRGIVWR